MKDTFVQVPDKWVQSGMDLNTAYVLAVIYQFFKNGKSYHMSNKKFVETYPVMSEKTLSRRIEVLKYLHIIVEVRRHGNNVAKLTIDESELEFFLNTKSLTIKKAEREMKDTMDNTSTVEDTDTMDNLSEGMDNLSTHYGQSDGHNGQSVRDYGQKVQTHIPYKVPDKVLNKEPNKSTNQKSHFYDFVDGNEIDTWLHDLEI